MKIRGKFNIKGKRANAELRQSYLEQKAKLDLSVWWETNDMVFLQITDNRYIGMIFLYLIKITDDFERIFFCQ